MISDILSAFLAFLIGWAITQTLTHLDLLNFLLEN